MTVRCIDIETTGTDPAKDVIVEIASVDLQRDNTIANFRETLVNPGITMPATASAVHHLIDADLAAAPPLEAVMDQFTGADAYVAHNCSFERSFLDSYLGEPTWVCTYKCALRVWPGPRRPWQPGAALSFRPDQPAGHRPRQAGPAPCAL